MTNFIRTFYFNDGPCNIVALVFICVVFILLCGAHDYVIFMFCLKEKTQQMKKLFADLDSLRVNV